jgi:glycosyltransferase involved in cell wall biosynthesis
MNSTKPEIDVLLATWNGAHFLEAQLNSLFRQTFQDFRLLIRDDGSSDSTLQIVERYRSRYSDRVFVTKNLARQGACRTFSLLSEQSAAPYVAFCDQDDIWHEDKLALSLSAMKESEARHGSDLPILVFSDMAIVDEDGRVIASSLWKQAHVRPDRATLGAMLVQNLVSGCTTLVNRNLLLKGCPIPGAASMHDAWLGLVAASFGILQPLHKTTVQYRQHRANAIGAGSGWRGGSLFQRLRGDQPFKDRIDASRQQSAAFARRYAHLLTPEQQNLFDAWSTSQTLPAFIRHWTLHRNGLRGTSFINNVGFLVRV